MLRFLGIPARVAAGFTSGKRENGGWVVTDHNAHAWVEVWFPDYGWLAFDPTPGARSAGRELQRLLDGVQRRRRSRRVRPAARGAERGGADELDRLLLLKERLAERQQAGAAPGRWRPAGSGCSSWQRSPSWARSASRSSSAVDFAISRATRDGSPARPGASSPTFSPTRVSPSGRAPRPTSWGNSSGTSSAPTVAGSPQRSPRRASVPPETSADAATRAHTELRALLRVIRRGLGRPARLRGLVALRSLAPRVSPT